MFTTLRLDKPCGGGHIADDLECHKGGVSQPVGKIQKKTGKESSQRGLLTGMGSAAKKAAIASAGLLGVSTTVYLATRAKYRAGFKESAQMAEDMAKGIKTQPVKSQQHTMIFTVGGMAYANESPEVISGERLATTMKMALSRNKGKDFKLVPVSNADANVPADRVRGGQLDQAVDVARIHYDRVVKNGRSSAAVNLAANVIAWADANPNTQIVMAGHSMGGFDVHEAQEILRIARPDLGKRMKSFAIGTEWMGMTNRFGESYTVGTPNDPFTSVFPTRDLKSFKDVKGHSQGAYFASPDVKQFMSDVIYRGVEVKSEKPEEPKPSSEKKSSRKPKNDSLDDFDDRFDAEPPPSLPTASSLTPQTQSQRQFYVMLKIVIERAYQDRVDRLFNCSVSGTDTTTGWFQDGLKIFKFELNPKGLTYAPVKSTRGDSQQVVFTLSLLPVLRFDGEAYEEVVRQHPDSFQIDDEYRQDTRRAKKCTSPGAYSCGNACIAGNRVCRIGGQKAATPGEVKAIAQAGRTIGLAQPENQAPPQTPEQASAQAKPTQLEDPYKDLSIRDLRDLAKNRVSRYSYMTKEQLKTAIKAADENPEQQERLRKTLEKAKARREADPLREYKKIKALSFLWKNKKGTAAFISAGSSVLGLAVWGYQRARQNYRGGFYESANTAESRAQGIKVETVPDTVKNITFTVDGFSYGETGNRGTQLETSLRTVDPKGFGKKHKLISVTGEEYTNLPGAGNAPQPVRGAVESYQALSRQLFETQIRGRNPQAVELAAQMYAYDKAYNETSDGKRKPSTQQKRISAIGYHEGGHVINEALEIFNIMNPDGAGNVRVVNIGTPHFGLTEQIGKIGKVKNTNRKISGRTITVTSPGDAFSIFPKMNPIQLNTVKGNGLNDYLSDPRALEVIRNTVGIENFGRRKSPERKPKAPAKNTGTAPVPNPPAQAPQSTQPSSGSVNRQPPPPQAPGGPGEVREFPKQATSQRKKRKAPRRKPKTDSNFYLDAFSSILGTKKEDAVPQGFVPELALKAAIAPTCPAITRVLSIELEGTGLTGKFVDNRRRLYRYRINGSDVSYSEILPPGSDRGDSFGKDQCEEGTPCKTACIKRGTNCRDTMSPASQEIVKLVRKTLEEEKIPTRGEILKVAGLSAKEFLKNPRQFIAEGRAREVAAMKALEATTGGKLPDKTLMAASLMKKAGERIDEQVEKVKAVATEPENVKEGVVATAGFVGSKIGAAVGGLPGQLVGDLAGAMATRKAINDYQRLQKAKDTLKENEAFAKAGKLKKLQMLNGEMLSDMRSEDAKKKAGDDMTGDIAGWMIGNAYASTAASSAVPFSGAVAALALTPVVVNARRKIKSGENVGTAINSAAEERIKIFSAPIRAVEAGNAREVKAREEASQKIRDLKLTLYAGAAGGGVAAIGKAVSTKSKK